MNYGKLLPSKFEIPEKFHPINNDFTKEFCGGNYKYEGLNTAYSYSNTHKNLDGDMWSFYKYIFKLNLKNISIIFIIIYYY